MYAQATFDWKATAELLTVEIDHARQHVLAGALQPAAASLHDASRIRLQATEGELEVNRSFREKAVALSAAASVCGQWIDRGQTQIAVDVLEQTLQENRVEIDATSFLFGKR